MKVTPPLVCLRGGQSFKLRLSLYELSLNTYILSLSLYELSLSLKFGAQA